MVVRVDELANSLDERLQAKYVRGMRGVLPALSGALGIFVALQQIAVEISHAVNTKLIACNEGRAGGISGLCARLVPCIADGTMRRSLRCLDQNP